MVEVQTAPSSIPREAGQMQPQSHDVKAKVAVGGCVTLLCGSHAATFGWREGITPTEFANQLRTAVCHVTGRMSLDGVELRLESSAWPDDAAGPGVTPHGLQRLAPRDLFEGRVGSETTGDSPRIRVIVPETVPVADPALGRASAVGGAVARTQSGLVGRASPASQQPQIQTRGKFQKAGGSQLQFMQMMAANKNPKPVLPPGLQLTVAEVARHKSVADCWTIFHGRVYDVTPYIDFHPGGKRQLMQGAGKDSTALFNKVHPWVSMDGLLGKLCLGLLVVDCPHVCETPSEADQHDEILQARTVEPPYVPAMESLPPK